VRKSEYRRCPEKRGPIKIIRYIKIFSCIDSFTSRPARSKINIPAEIGKKDLSVKIIERRI